MATVESTDPIANGKHDYREIVVALDGSAEAETILPYVEPIARAFSSRITLVYALVPVEDTVSGEMVLAEAVMAPTALESVYETHDLIGDEESSYLATMKRRWAARGLDVDCREPRMRAAEAIVAVTEETGAGLIAMATHSRRGVERAVRGSVADVVVRTAPCPVLLVRPE